MEIRNVKVLGSGCSNCQKLEKTTIDALKQLGLKVEVEHVTDFSEIAQYGVMRTPALVVNDQVVSAGKVLKTNEVIDLINQLSE